jgi:antitoxin (DNA-binding transcriptional repressor) of toxin-antitoxin stability system
VLDDLPLNETFVLTMSMISLHDAQAKLPILVHGLAPGDEIVITEGDRPVAKIVPAGAAPMPRQLGTLRGTVLYMSPDFDAPLEEFKEYLT